MRAEILHLLRTNNGMFLSGEWISETLGCSRTAVWKHIRTLMEHGYTIEAVRNKGYRLTGDNPVFSADEVAAKVNALFPDTYISFFDSVASTQEIAHEIVHRQAPEQGIVVAERQTEGKGRLGRTFSSESGTGIWMSVILRPELPVNKMPQLTLVTAVAICKAVREVTGAELSIKWPNDLLLNGKKCCGILTEVQSDPDEVKSVIIGIGLNVNHEGFPDWLQEQATSLRLELNKTFDRTELIAELMRAIDTFFLLYAEKGFPVIKPLWEASAIPEGQRIRARTIQGIHEGVGLGIDHDGTYLLKKDDGTIEHLYSADLEEIN